jgi:hypothetical protein
MAASSSILWRRLDQPGHDSARLTMKLSGPVLVGTAVFEELQRPCRLDYEVTCDDAWRTLSARVAGWLGPDDIDLRIDVDAERNWTLNGQRCPEVRGCDDIDLSFSPATNLLPIRRTALPIGGRVSVRAAWLRFPDPALELLDQVYERLAETQYRYQSAGGSFMTTLETNESGFVTHYPELWQIEHRID